MSAHDIIQDDDVVTVTFDPSYPIDHGEARILALIRFGAVDDDAVLVDSADDRHRFRLTGRTRSQASMIGLLDDLRNAVHSLGYLDEGSAEQANAVLMLGEGLFRDLADSARAVLRS